MEIIDGNMFGRQASSKEDSFFVMEDIRLDQVRSVEDMFCDGRYGDHRLKYNRIK